MIAALLKEIDIQRNYLQCEKVETIYFGGGTPSLLAIEDPAGIIKAIRDQFNVVKDAEITLECNPDDISIDKLAGWQEAGINRLSIGVQSFFEEDLRWMNRAHSAVQAKEGLQLALQYFNNITADLIYGSPAMTEEKWKKNVDQLLSFDIPHISCYALTVEPRTPLQKLIRQGRSDNVDPDIQSEQFVLLMDWLETAGYEHYEISNFSKPGMHSRHNRSYWEGKKYLGIGPSSHSFNGASRQWNIANNSQYIRSVSEGIVPFEIEMLTSVQQLNEYIMISLRTKEGLDLSVVEKKFGEPSMKRILGDSRKYIEDHKMIYSGTGFLRLTKRESCWLTGLRVICLNDFIRFGGEYNFIRRGGQRKQRRKEIQIRSRPY